MLCAENSAKQTKRGRKKKLYGIALVIIIVSAASLFFWYSMTNEGNQAKAVIVDGGGDMVGVNPWFIVNATETLEQAGYRVHYIAPEEVTVDFYKNLPTFNYRIILLRVQISGSNIYSGETYNKWKYVAEQLAEEVVQGGWWGNESYFAITPLFVKNSMRERFRNSIIINMGCNTLMGTTMAEQFIERGAKAYIGWKSSQPIKDADQSTELLLKHLITEEKTIEQAVNETMEEKSTYPILSYYPLDAGTTVITDELFEVDLSPDYLMILLEILIPVDIVGGIAVIVDIIFRRRKKREKAMARLSQKGAL